MPEFRQRDAAIWVSKLPETTFNTFYTAGTDYLKARSQNAVVLIPEQEKSNDAGFAGNGHEFPTFQCNRYWLPMSLGLTDQVNFELAGRLALRALSGAVTDTTLSGGVAYKHACNMMPVSQGLFLKSMDVISELGGASFLFPGAVVESYRMEQNGADPPNFTANLINSGKHRSPHQVGVAQVETATAAGTISGTGNASVTITAANLPGSPIVLAVPVVNGDTAAQWADKVRIFIAAHALLKEFFFVSGASTSIVLTTKYIVANDATLNIALANGTCTGITAAPTSADTTSSSVTLPQNPTITQCLKPKVEAKWTDSGGTRDFTSPFCSLRSFFVEVINNHAPTDDRCAGDPEQKEADPLITTGAGVASYLARLSRGDRQVNAQIVALLDFPGIPDWVKMAQNEALTNVTFTAIGPELGSSGFFNKLSFIIPQARISSVQEVDSNGKAALTINLLALYDATSGGALQVEVHNGLDGASPDYN